MSDITLSELKERIQILPESVATALRRAYIHRFVDIDSDYFRRSIAAEKKYTDGWYYEGYLWNCLKSFQIIREETFYELLCEKGAVYLFWDLHSEEKILTRPYWHFPRDAVLRLEGTDAVRGERYFPDDIYTFDASLEWTLVRTYTILDAYIRRCACAS